MRWATSPDHGARNIHNGSKPEGFVVISIPLSQVPWVGPDRHPSPTVNDCVSRHCLPYVCLDLNASPLRTNHSARSTPSIEHTATVRPYRSRLTGEQSTGRRAMKASSSFAALAPHRYCKLSSFRQTYLDSAPPIPQIPIPVPSISIY